MLGTESFSTTRAGYRAMLRWFALMASCFVYEWNPPVPTEPASPGTWHSRVSPVLEVTGPDPASRRAKGKDDALDAISAAERRAQDAGSRWPKTVPAPWSLRVLRTTRKTAIKCRRAALQQLHNTIVAAPEEVRDQVPNLTRMRRLRTCAA